MRMAKGKRRANRAVRPPLGAEQVIHLFVNKWAIRVIHCLARSPERPSQLRRLLRPISQKVLTETLRNLENAGLVRRELVRQKPLTVRYSLTPLGRTFVRPLNELCHWALEHQPELNKAARDISTGNLPLNGRASPPRKAPVLESLWH
jgi:DNA-binding HxlR family transcriptional regulator